MEADENIMVTRLRDPLGGQAGVRNICDYIVYLKPYSYYLELKSRQGNTLNFREITKNQWEGLRKIASKPGVIPGVVVNYSDHNKTYFVHINVLVYLKEKQGRKSIHINEAQELGVELLGERKRTRFNYYAKNFLENIGELYG